MRIHLFSTQIPSIYLSLTARETAEMYQKYMAGSEKIKCIRSTKQEGNYTNVLEVQNGKRNNKNVRKVQNRK